MPPDESAAPSAANESTPLIQVVRVQPRRPRYPHTTLRRFCTVALGSTLLLILVLFLLPLSWLPGPGHGGHGPGDLEPIPTSLPHRDWPAGDGMAREEVRRLMRETPDADTARRWSEYYTAGPHLAGKNRSQAEWTRDKWAEFGIEDVEIKEYEVYINYPKDHGLRMFEEKKGHKKKGKKKYELVYEASLEEDVLDEDPTTQLEDRVPTFHGYSASGNVTAQFVFVNFGTYWDFEDLLAAGVELEGKIAIAKYGVIFRGLKVKRAQELGMVGVVIYSDPQEDGDIIEQNGHLAYPEGPARNPSSVQRGSVQFINVLPGDPTTPGYPSLPGVNRTDPSYSTPQIPSLPISYRDAIPILRALNGHGPKAKDMNENWEGGRLTGHGVKYNIGPSSHYLSLWNEQTYVTNPLWDVVGVINGSVHDEVVVIGNHRDAWIAGGAGDPNSGSAALNEVVRALGKAVAQGWRPLRTIVFASWDGEEYGLIGSTEWVEEHLPWLSKSAVAYLNLDVGATGPQFRVSASPLLNQVLRTVAGEIPSPDDEEGERSIADTWDGDIYPMGSGSDFTAFQDFAGIASLDFAFTRSPDSAVYHYHSNYDSFHWMESFGDVGFRYHAVAAQVLGGLLARIADEPLLPFNLTEYADALAAYLDAALALADAHPAARAARPPLVRALAGVASDPAALRHHHHPDHNLPSAPSDTSYASSSKPHLKPLRRSIRHLARAARAFDARVEAARDEAAAGMRWWRWWRRGPLFREAGRLNARMKRFEREFLHEGGLDGRDWFKHVVFAPGKWTGYSGATFPGLIEALEAGNDTAVEKWTAIIKEKIDSATQLLKS